LPDTDVDGLVGDKGIYARPDLIERGQFVIYRNQG
jgi:hypothetical protein